MSETWTIKCDGCGTDLVNFTADYSHAVSRDRWLTVAEREAIQPGEQRDRQDFCSWACLAKHAADQAP
ncbi:MAG TPA: hypothetical protein VMV92_05385 [Streptosporangiaceae bacterium]|nr:hypothetical protein [Streptosporangiaceae bacterium]